jgi:HEAT repeat protein
MLGAAPHAVAVEPRLASDIVSGEDFRVRVSAALALGKSRDASAREILEKALANDSHPAVRAAAAAALGALGDASAAAALRRAQESDPENAVRASAKVALGKLGPAVRAKVLVKIGKMTNRSGVRGDSMASVLGQATRERASKLSGVEVLSDDSDHLAIAAARKLPVLVIDGNVAHLKQSASGSAVQMAAKVEYVFRKEASLKATVSGAAAAEGAVDTLRDDRRVQNLQEAALVGAVESALRNPDGLLAAAK